MRLVCIVIDVRRSLLHVNNLFCQKPVKPYVATIWWKMAKNVTVVLTMTAMTIVVITRMVQYTAVN